MAIARRLSLVLVLAVCASAGPSNTSVIKGVVRDSEGAAIGGAYVLIHWDSSGSTVGLTTNLGSKEDTRVTTNRTGEFSVEVPPGFYDVFVSAMSFSPQCRKIRVRAGETSTYSPKLKPDPLVGKELP